MKTFSSLNQTKSTAWSGNCFSSCLQHIKCFLRFVSDHLCSSTLQALLEDHGEQFWTLTTYLCQFFKLIPKWNELYAIMRRAVSVCLSVHLSVCKHLHKSLLLPEKWLGRHQIRTRWSPGRPASMKPIRIIDDHDECD